MNDALEHSKTKYNFLGKYFICVSQQMKFITLFLIRQFKHTNQLQQCAYQLPPPPCRVQNKDLHKKFKLNILNKFKFFSV